MENEYIKAIEHMNANGMTSGTYDSNENPAEQQSTRPLILFFLISSVIYIIFNVYVFHTRQDFEVTRLCLLLHSAGLIYTPFGLFVGSYLNEVGDDDGYILFFMAIILIVFIYHIYYWSSYFGLIEWLTI